MRALIENKTLIIIVVLVALGGAWFWLSGSNDDTQDILSSTDATGGQTSGGSEDDLFVSLLELRSINLDDQIFANPAFASLRDRGTDIVGEPVGRENPFAPFESPSRSVSENTSEEGPEATE